MHACHVYLIITIVIDDCCNHKHTKCHQYQPLIQPEAWNNHLCLLWPPNEVTNMPSLVNTDTKELLQWDNTPVLHLYTDWMCMGKWSIQLQKKEWLSGLYSMGTEVLQLIPLLSISIYMHAQITCQVSLSVEYYNNGKTPTSVWHGGY